MSSEKRPRFSQSLKKELELERRLTLGKVFWPVMSIVVLIAISGYLFGIYRNEKINQKNQPLRPEEKIQNRPIVPEEDSKKEGQEGDSTGKAAEEKEPAETTQKTEYENYTIQEGDTLGAIASLKGVTVDEILALNPGIVAENLQIGQIIKIPKKQ